MRLFIFDSQMAGVVVDAEAPGQTLVPRSIRLHFPQKRDGLSTGLQVTQRLRLQAEVQILACAAAELIKVLDAAPQVCPHDGRLLGAGDELPKTARDST